MRSGGLLRILALAVLITLVILIGEFAGRSNPQSMSGPVYGGQLNLAISMPLISLNPYASVYGAQNEISPLLFGFLVVPMGGDRYEPELAQYWQTDKDRMEWTFFLRPNSRFHDGRPIRASDVAWSIRRASPVNSVIMEVIREMDSSDPRQLIIRLHRPLPDFLYQLSVQPIVPETSGGEDATSANPATGSGPFRVQNFVKDSLVVLERNPDFIGEGGTYLDRIRIEYEPDKEKIWTNYVNDRLHACWSASPENIWFLRQNPTEYPLEGRVAPRVTLVLFNVRHPFFQDREVRGALADMLDIDRHIREDLSGMAVLSPGPLGVRSPLTRKTEAGWEHSPDSIRKALKQAGWEDHDGDGYLDRNGQAFEFDLWTPKTFQMERKTAVWIQRTWNLYGIKAHVRYERFDRLVEEQVKTGRLQAMLTQHSTGRRRFRHLPVLWSSGPRGVYNFSGYHNEKVDQALEDLIGAGNRAGLDRALQVVHKELVRDQPAIWLYQNRQVHAFSRRLKGLRRPDPDYYQLFSLRGAWLEKEQSILY